MICSCDDDVIVMGDDDDDSGVGEALLELMYSVVVCLNIRITLRR